MHRFARREYGTTSTARPAAPAIAQAQLRSNQARLRQLDGSHRQTGPATPPPTTTTSAPATPAAAPTSIDVWGLHVTRSMCGCKDNVRDGIAWANTAAATYATCNTPANTTGSAVDACFDAAQPDAVVDAQTDAGGTMTLPPPSTDPCRIIENKGSLVHETMHSRHTDELARGQSGAFFQAWKALAGDRDRLTKMRAKFPAETAAFEARWHEGADWARDEVHSYTWERRFLVDALAALNRIC